MTQIRMGWLLRLIGSVGLLAISTSCGGTASSGQSSAVIVVDVSTASPTPLPIQEPPALPIPSPNQIPTVGIIVQAGDSIGVGLGAGDWAAIDHLGFSSYVGVYNVSLSGKSMQTGYGYRGTELFPLRSMTSPSILLIQQGTNDLYYGTTAESLYKGILTPFVSDARKAGFYVIVDTILPRTDSGWTAGMERQRIAYNALVRANRAGADAINDLAADPLMGDGSDQTGAGYYADGAHPSLIGQQRLAILNAAVLAPFLQRPMRTPRR